MNSLAHGETTSGVEVTNISGHGLWLFVRGKEYFLAYDDFPWFLDQPVKTIVNVEEPSPGHFYWPDIDVDLSETIIEHPERFPLRSKSS